MKILFFIIKEKKKINEKTINDWLKSSNENMKKQEEKKEGFDEKIEKELGDLKRDIERDKEEILNLTYSSNVNNTKISGYNEGIKICLVLLECYLRILDDTNSNFVDFFKDLKDSCEIEHLYPKNLFKDKEEFIKAFNDNLQKDIFASEERFLKERAKFSNLTLLSKTTNQSLGDKYMKEKIEKYSKAEEKDKAIFLTQSLADNSQFYNNKTAFEELNPKSRKIIIKNDVAWNTAKTTKIS